MTLGLKARVNLNKPNLFKLVNPIDIICYFGVDTGSIRTGTANPPTGRPI